MCKNIEIDVYSGGGIRGVLSIRLASQLAFKPHLICGTSTGAIIAAARAIGMDLNEIMTAYLKYIPLIFKTDILRVNPVFKSKYDRKNLEKALTEIFGEKRSRDCKIPLMINAYQISPTRKPKYWKSWEDDFLIRDVVAASCSAPVYFMPKTIDDAKFIDGGMESNNIADGALIEALYMFPNSNISINAIGTGEWDGEIEIKNGGIFDWKMGTAVIEVMLDANQKASIYKAEGTIKKLNELGASHTLQVLNRKLEKNIALDDVNATKYLLNL